MGGQGLCHPSSSVKEKGVVGGFGGRVGQSRTAEQIRKK